MKKIGIKIVAAALSVMLLVPALQAQKQGGSGIEGFLTGCCFGLRVGVDYNDSGTGNKNFVPWFLVGCCFGIRAQEDFSKGKEIHWREWCRAIPYIGLVFSIWDGVDTMSGTSRNAIQQRYGEMYY